MFHALMHRPGQVIDPAECDMQAGRHFSATPIPRHRLESPPSAPHYRRSSLASQASNRNQH